MSEDSKVLRVLGFLDQLKGGDQKARDGLLTLAFDRLTQLAHVMLRDYPSVSRWEQTDDVLQSAAMRLHRALAEVTPATPRDFYRLAAAQIRRELLDLARRHSGPHGLGANHESHDLFHDRGPLAVACDDSHDPARLAEWSALHEQAGALPDELGLAFDLIYYQGLTRTEVAEVLGVSERTVKRYWQQARLALHDALGGRLPGV